MKRSWSTHSDSSLTHHYASTRWRRLRLQIFARDGWSCVKCRADGVHSPAEECDHVVPSTKTGPVFFYDPDNLQSLCRKCHKAKSDKERRKLLPFDVATGRPMEGRNAAAA